MPEVDRGHPEAGFVEFEPLAGAAADLILVLVAFFIMLIAGAGWVIFYCIDGAFFGISIFGFRPFKFLSDLFFQATRSMWQKGAQQVIHLARSVWGFLCSFWRSLYVIVTTFQWLWGWVDGTNQAIARAMSAAAAKEQNDVNTIDNIVARESTNLQNQINAWGIQEPLDISRAQAAANTFAQAVADQVQARESIDVRNLQTNINTETNQRLAQVGQVQTNLQANINHVYDLTEADIAQATNTLHNQITNGVTTAENFATGLVSGLGIGTIANTLTALQGRLAKVETETADCLTPLCDTVTPQAPRLGRLGQNFKNLEDLGVIAILVALAAECLTDPAAVADDIGTVVGGVGRPLVSAARDLIGA